MTRSSRPLILGLPRHSCVRPGRIWPKPRDSARLKELNVYRFDPESDEGPRLDTYFVDLDDCGPMVLDAVIKIKDAGDSSLTCRQS